MGVKSRPLVAIVGRPNVGKSTLFNRFVGERMAIVDDQPGVTRDRLYLPCEWAGREFIIIDTGGILFEEEGHINTSVQQQAWLAVDEADVIVFVVDGQMGIHPDDMIVAKELRHKAKSVILAVNKVDELNDSAMMAADFYQIGLGEPIPISAIHRNNTGNLLDEIVAQLNLDQGNSLEEEEGISIAIVGRPNVGKSSIVNTLLNQERMTVSEISGTTRDAVDSVCKINGEKFVLIDTAGIRKKAKVRYGVERFSVVRAIKAIQRADVVVLVIDASEPVSEQDQRIAGMAQDLGKASLIVVNKWDLVDQKDSGSMNAHSDEVREKLYFMNYAPILYTSTVTKKRLWSIFELAKAALEENQRRITTGLFNEVLNEIVAMNPPPARKSRRPRISYGTQVSVTPPTFVLFTNYPGLVDPPYLRHVERRLRENFGFTGTPLRLLLREDVKRKARGEARKAGTPTGKKRASELDEMDSLD
ncbi:MAG: ribosome biogenesis GTPase Der [Candidatus Sericytochromatia bacterium]